MNPENIYFLSDTHFFHKGVIGYSKRPYSSVEEMNEALISNWNAVVPRNGHVFHLGDFSFGRRVDTEEILRRLNGTKYLILGNHDSSMNRFKKYFCWIKDYYELTVVGFTHQQKIVLFHYPIGSWNKCHWGSWQLHGHCHGNFMHHHGRQIDVGVDALPGYRPYSYREIAEIMSKKDFEAVDHHHEKDLVE